MRAGGRIAGAKYLHQVDPLLKTLRLRRPAAIVM
jgi:hypothetical protein